MKESADMHGMEMIKEEVSRARANNQKPLLPIDYSDVYPRFVYTQIERNN